MTSSKRETNYGSFDEFHRDLPSALSRAIACLQVKPSVKPSSLLESLWSYVSSSPPEDLWPYGLDEDFLENLLQRLGFERTRRSAYKIPNQRDILLLDLTALARQSSCVYILDELGISPVPAAQESKEPTVRELPKIAPVSQGFHEKLCLAAKSFASDEYYQQLEFHLRLYRQHLSLPRTSVHHVWPYGINELNLKLFLKSLNDLTDLLNGHDWFLKRIDQKSFLTTAATHTKLTDELQEMAEGLKWFFEMKPWLKCKDAKDELQHEISSVKTSGVRL